MARCFCPKLFLLIVFVHFNGKAFSNSISNRTYYKCCPEEQVLHANDKEQEPKCANIDDVYPLEMDNMLIGGKEMCETNSHHICWDKMIRDGGGDVGDVTRTAEIVRVTCDPSRKPEKYNAAKVLRKCCPKNYVYVPSEHRCVGVRSNGYVNFLDYFEARNESLTNVKVGMWDCDGAIKDRVVNATKFASNLTDDAIEKLRLDIMRKHAKSDDGYCLDFTDEDNVWVLRVCQNVAATCRTVPCVRKCCQDGYYFEGNKCDRSSSVKYVPPFHRKTYNSSWSWDAANVEDFAQVQGHKCKNKMYLLSSKFDIKLSDRGFLHLNDGLVLNPTKQTYCMEYVVKKKSRMDGYYYFNCFSENDPEKYEFKVTILRFFLFMSCIFLFITVVIYSWILPINLHSKTILSHCISLMIAYGCLLFSQWKKEEQSIKCVIIGYCNLYSFIAAFSWLNVMCFDIWWTFGSFRGVQMKSKENRKFIWYSIYGWIFPLSILACTIAADYGNFIEDKYKPGIGINSCFFSIPYGYSYYALFIGPIGLQTICNIIFFYITIRYCIQVKSEIHRMQESRKKLFILDKTNLILNLKLFTVMGISWILELVSSLLGDSHPFWLGPDIYNACQGFFIFIIYVMKPNVIKEIKNKLGFKSQSESNSGTMTSGLCTSTAALKSDNVRKISQINSVAGEFEK